MKRRWYYSLPVKLLALVLLLACLAGAGLGAAGTAICGASGFYSEEGPQFVNYFRVRKILYQQYEQDIHTVLEMQAQLPKNEAPNRSQQEYLNRVAEKFSPENTNLYLVLAKGDGETLPFQSIVGGQPPENLDSYQLVTSISTSLELSFDSKLNRWLQLVEEPAEADSSEAVTEAVREGSIPDPNRYFIDGDGNLVREQGGQVVAWASHLSREVLYDVASGPYEVYHDDEGHTYMEVNGYLYFTGSMLLNEAGERMRFTYMPLVGMVGADHVRAASTSHLVYDRQNDRYCDSSGLVYQGDGTGGYYAVGSVSSQDSTAADSEPDYYLLENGSLIRSDGQRHIPSDALYYGNDEIGEYLIDDRYGQMYRYVGGDTYQLMPGTGSVTEPDADYVVIEGAVSESEPLPHALVTVYYYLNTELPAADAFRTARWEFLDMRAAMYVVLVLLAAGMLLSLVLWIFLMCAAGHRPDTDKEVITLRLLDRIPLDLLLGLCTLIFAPMLVLAMDMLSWGNMRENLQIVLAALMACVLAILGIVLTLTAAVRFKSRTLLRNTLVWRICAWAWNGLTGGAKKVTGRLQKEGAAPVSEEEKQAQKAQKQEQRAQTMDKVGQGARRVGGFFSACGNGLLGAVRGAARILGEAFGQIGLHGKGVVFLAGVLAVQSACCLLLWTGGFILLLLMLLFDLWLLMFWLSVLKQLSWLRDGAKRIAQGDLNYRIPSEVMKWEFKEHAETLNTIRAGIDNAVEERVKAVRERTKSDRLRTELLTNVSHDIKTPLTSIINYVDLLKKEEVGGEKAQEYIAVLDRQSIRLKKLLEDLLEASKAQTGNITVNAAPTNVGELLRQVTGEYAEKLAAAQIEPIITLPGRDAVIFADGKLLWRVFDNLMANIVKYAMPQTRVYLDLRNDAEMTVIAVKNVSRERLNIAADELMERFVRGDSSRSTEGSGLGLSIAQSLTELMGGQFELMIDGDLFKVRLSFPTMDTAEDADTQENAPVTMPERMPVAVPMEIVPVKTALVESAPVEIVPAEIVPVETVPTAEENREEADKEPETAAPADGAAEPGTGTEPDADSDAKPDADIEKVTESE